ncbi:MAG: hypothetical protein QXI31_00105 [Archaeoglobaceae archaeon]
MINVENKPKIVDIRKIEKVIVIDSKKGEKLILERTEKGWKKVFYESFFENCRSSEESGTLFSDQAVALYLNAYLGTPYKEIVAFSRNRVYYNDEEHILQ